MATKKFDRTVWHGTDCDKVTSLFEYGLLVRYITKTGYCWYCDTVNWVKEDGKDVGI